MSIPALGRLERVELRAAWGSESDDFTPWLALDENLRLLGETIGIDLELEAQEKSVGPFRADILCKETTTGNWVLIENQLERTDHTHLGQLLTYAAGLEAVRIVWIAERFTEEHRATLDWLNEITDERFNFFGLEVELWRIGGSQMAPKFNVVSKPNDWTKKVSGAAAHFQLAELTERKQLWLEYWTEFRDYLQQQRSFLKTQKPLPQHWYNFTVGRSYFVLSALAGFRDKWIKVALTLSGPDAKAHYHLLLQHREDIELEIGETLVWDERPDYKESHVYLIKNNVDPMMRSDWTQQYMWFRETLEKFHKAFAARIKTLDASSYIQAAGND
ncbi:MAG: DUF4268 domain-containing protein [Pyrinomonadaceae bacterium]